MLRKRNSLRGSIKHHFTFPYISNRGFFFMTFYYFENHTSYRLSYMHVYLLSHFPLVSFFLFAVGVKKRRRQCWVLSYLEESSLKWATVIHQLPSSPWGPCGSALSLEIPKDTALFLYLRFILFPSLHISLSVSLSAALLLWPLALAVSLVSSHASVCGDDFLLDANANFLHCQPRTTETLHSVLRLFLLCCLRTPSAAVTPFPFLPPLTFLYFLVSFLFFRVDPMAHDTPKPPGYTRFVCISDTHSRTDSIQMPYGDVFIHAGDFTELGLPSEVKKFNDWLGQHL